MKFYDDKLVYNSKEAAKLLFCSVSDVRALAHILHLKRDVGPFMFTRKDIEKIEKFIEAIEY